MKARAGRWLKLAWPSDRDRQALVGEYAAIGAQHRLFLADVALRGRVFSDVHTAGDRDQTFINIGRRELALEILELCNERPDRLWELIPRPADQKGND